jgi:hypothetical protein
VCQGYQATQVGGEKFGLFDNEVGAGLLLVGG